MLAVPSPKFSFLFHQFRSGSPVASLVRGDVGALRFRRSPAWNWLLAGTTTAAGAVAFYLVAYTVTMLTACGIVTVLSTSEADTAELEDYRGLFWRRISLKQAHRNETQPKGL